jgi:hypothetical protein
MAENIEQQVQDNQVPEQGNPIYKFMKSNNLTKLDEKAFLDVYSKPEKAKEVHDFMLSNKLTNLDETKFYDTYLKKKEQPVPTEKPSQVSAKSSQLGVTEKAVPTTSELGVGEEAPIVPSWKMGGKEPLAKESTFVRPTTKIDIEKQQQIKEIQNNALTNTAKNKLSAKGLQATPANISSEIKNIEQAAKDGEVSLVRKGNEYYYGRTPKWHEEFAKQFVSTIGKFTDNIDILVADSKNDPALMVKTLDDIKARKDVESRMTFNVFDMMKAAIDPSTSVAENAMKVFNAEKDKTPLAKPTLAGDIAGFVGGIAPKAMASSFGLVPTAVQAVMTSSQDKIEQLYDKYQQDFLASDPTASAEYQQTGVIPQKIKEAAATKAIKNADIQATPTALLDAILFSGTGAKATPQAKNLGEALARGFKHANIMGAKGTAAELATIGIEQAQGDKPEDIVRRLADTYGNWVAIDASFRGLEVLKSLPKYLSSAIKDFATSKEAKPIIDEYLNKLPNGKEIKAELNKWEEDKKPLEGIVPEDKMGAVNGLNQKIKGLKEKLNQVPESLKEDIKVQIDNTNKQIKDIVSSDKPAIEFEKDDLTGETLGEKPIEITPEVKPIPIESRRQEQYDVLADLAKKNPNFKLPETFEEFNKNIDTDATYLDKLYDRVVPFKAEIKEFEGGTKQSFKDYLTEKPTEVTTTPVTTTEVKTTEIIPTPSIEATTEAIQPEVKITIDSESLKKNTQPEVDRVKNLPLENEDGATFNLDGTKHEGGLVVPVESLNTTRAELTPELINDFVEKNKDKISGDNFKVGIYKFPNSEKVSIDLNIVVDPKFKDAALEFGKLAGQESLFDLDSFQNVKTGATGENPKSFTPKEFFDIAKSLAKGEVPEMLKAPEVKAEIKAEPKTVADTVADDLFTHLGIEPEVKPEVAQQQLVEKTKSKVDDVKNALSAIAPDIKIEMHETIADTEAGARKAGLSEEGVQESKKAGGYYNPNTNTIHLNLEKIKSNTLFHEGVHPILNAIHAIDSKAVDKLFNQVKTIEKRLGLEKKYSEDFASAYDKEQQSMEAVTEFLADVVDGKIKITETNFDKVKQFFVDMMKAVGIDLSNKIKTIQDLKKLADSIAKGFERGDVIRIDESGEPLTKSPIEIKDIQAQKITGEKVEVKEHKLSFVKESDLFDIDKFLKEVSDKKQKIWFWVADQLGRGMYTDKFVNGEHYLDAGASYALDPVNRNKGIIWATGKGNKWIEGKIKESDYIAIISGSPEKSKLFNKQVFDLFGKRIKDYDAFKKDVLKVSNVSEINNLLKEFENFEDLKNNPKRKDLLLAINEQKGKKTPLVDVLNKYNAFLDYNELRDGFYADNDFKMNDIMLVLKPESFGGESKHSTYENDILGKVIGVPNKKINAYDLLPSDVKQKYEVSIAEKNKQRLAEGKGAVTFAESQKAQVVAPYGVGVKEIQYQKPTKGVDLVENSGKRKEMTEDDKGNYLFFHYSDKKFNKLSPEKVGKHLATGRDERTSVPTSSLYTRPDRLETNVPSDFGYITRVPKEKVYSFDADPLNLMAEAEARFKKENKDRAFDANNQFAYVAKIASEKGFPVTVAEWNIKGTKTLIAKTTEALPLEKYTNIKAGTTNQIEFAKGTEDIKPNAKRRDIQFQKEEPTEIKGKLEGKPTTFIKNPEDLEVVNGFYSPIEKRLLETKIEKQSANKWKEIVGKGDEAKFTGVSGWLESLEPTQQVSKSEIQKWMKDNRIEISEVVKEEPTEGDIDAFLNDEVGEGYTREEAKDYLKNEQDATKYSEYQLSGEKSNYKEVLVTLPKKGNEKQLADLDNFKKELSKKYGEDFKGSQLTDSEINKLQELKLNAKEEGDKFKSSHYDEPNILAHIRMNTRVDAEGNKVLHIEEFQSDWGQQGKKQGFKKEFNASKYQELQTKLLQGIQKMKREGKIEKDEMAVPYEKVLTTQEVKQLRELEQAKSTIDKNISEAPFVTNTADWTKLAWKVALKEAVKEGADKITWTTGEQQNARYDLRKQVDNINYVNNGDGTYQVYAKKDGNIIFKEKSLKENQLEGAFGKDVAKKIIADEGKSQEGLATKQLSGDDLMVGGTGMKGFYGSPSEGKIGIVGEVAKSLFKQEPKTTELDIKTIKLSSEAEKKMAEEGWTSGEPSKEAYSTQHSIDITPEMKAQVEAGLPQFQKEGQDAKIKDFIEMQREKGISDKDIKAGLEKAADRIGLDKNKIDELLTTKKEANAIQEPSPESILQPTQEGAGEAGGKRTGMEQAEQGAIPPKEGKPSEAEVGGIEEKVGITKKDLKQLEQDYEVDLSQRREKITDVEMQDMAKNLIDSGYDVAKLVKKSLEEEKYVPTDLELNILAEHAADMKAKIDANSSNADIAKYRDILSAINRGTSEAGRALRMAQVKKGVVDSIADVMADIMDDYKVDELTKEQRVEAEERFKVIEDSLNKYKESLDKVNAELEKLKAEKALQDLAEKNKKDTPAKRAKTNDDYANERKVIIASIKEKWNKASKGGAITAVPLPFSQQLAAIAPDVAKLIGSYLEQGAAKTLDEVRSLLKKDIEDIGIKVTDEEVSRLIAGEGATKKESKNELARQRYEIKEEQKLLLELENLEQFGEPETRKEKIQKNQKLAELRKKIKDLTGEDLDDKFIKTANQRIKANETKLNKIQEKIDAGDFTKEPKPQSVLDSELLQEKNKELYNAYLKSVVDKDEAMLNYERARVNDKIKNESKLNKIGRYADIALNTSKGTVAMFDQSYFLVQMLPFTFSHPLQAIKFAKEALLKDFISADRFKRTMAILHESPLYDLIEKTGLAVFEPRSFKSELRTELHGGEKNLWNKEFEFRGKKYSIGQAFERSTTSFMNNARISLFMDRVKDLYEAGKTFENSPEEFKSAARAINELTGQGKVQEHIQMASPVVNKIIWSPKMFASTLNILGLGDVIRPIETSKAIGRGLGFKIKETEATKGFYSSLTPEQRKFALKEVSRFVGMGATLMVIAQLSGADDVDVDPRSSGFGTITFGNKTYNVFGRFASAARTIVQVGGGVRMLGGQKDVLGDKFGDKTAGDVLYSSFGRGKMTPAAGLTSDLILNNRKNYYTKEEIDLASAAKSLAIPLAAQDMQKDFKRDDVLTAAGTTIAKLYGANISDKRDFEAKMKSKGKKGGKGGGKGSGKKGGGKK